MRAARWRPSSGQIDHAVELGDRRGRIAEGEVDWVEQPLIDLRPMLRTSPDGRSR